MKALVVTQDVLITPEGLDRVLSMSLRSYTTRGERAAMRGGLIDAASLCDRMADEIIAQNRHGSRAPKKLVLQMAAAFKRCGDEIQRMRDRVTVPTED